MGKRVIRCPDLRGDREDILEELRDQKVPAVKPFQIKTKGWTQGHKYFCLNFLHSNIATYD